MACVDPVASFKSGFNCAQALLLGTGPRYGMAPELCLKIAAPFGAGMGRTGSTCGAVTGAIMVIGLRCGHSAANDKQTKERCYAATRDFLERFRAVHGSVVCNQLLGLDISTPQGFAESRARDLHNTLCVGLVKSAAQILGEVLSGLGPFQ